MIRGSEVDKKILDDNEESRSPEEQAELDDILMELLKPRPKDPQQQAPRKKRERGKTLERQND